MLAWTNIEDLLLELLVKVIAQCKAYELGSTFTIYLLFALSFDPYPKSSEEMNLVELSP